MSDLPPPSGSSVSQPPPSKRPSGSALRTGALVAALSLLSVVSVLAIASAVGEDRDDETNGDGASVATESTSPEGAPAGSDSDGATTTTSTTLAPTTVATTTTTTSTTSVAATPPPTEVTTSSDATTDAESVGTESTTSTSEPAEDEAGEVEAGDPEPASSDDETTSEAAPATPDSDEASSYPVLPDGSPVPVEVVYDGAVVTLTGLVPSQDARQRLEALAIAGAPRPDTTAVNMLEINEDVPLSVGARVLSLDSVRFPTGSAEITEAHAAEIDGVVQTMGALPNVTLLVVGHSDQRGDDESNLELSQERAEAMVLYLASQGIEPSRMSSRAVGESNPISEANSAAALQLNRRTELLFYGLLAE